MDKIATHNSLTYAKPKKWWMKPFKIFAQCQDKTVEQQLNAGVTLFDIRVRFDKDGKPYACHGLMEYDIEVEPIIQYLLNHNIYVQLVLETSKYDERQEELFKLFCEEYDNPYLIGRVRKYDWVRIHNGEQNPCIITSYFASAPNINSIWKIYPKIWAKRHKNVQYSTEYYTMIDFV